MQEHKLTLKQEAFCVAYLETGNASEAYRRAYDASRTKPNVVYVKASQLMAQGKVSVRLAELRAVAAKAASVTLEGHLGELQNLRDMAIEARQFSAAIAAEVARGKAAGVCVERVELTGKNGAPVRIVAIQLVGVVPG